MDLSRRDVLGSGLTLLAGRAATTAANAQEVEHLWRRPHRFRDHERAGPLSVGHSL